MRLDLTRRYRRWRHGRGFGIHSPFAYDFITRTLRERLPYYGYERLAAMQFSSDSGDGLSIRRLRLIFRIAVRFNPSSAAVTGLRDAAAMKATLRAVKSNIKFESSPADTGFAVICDDTAIEPLPEKAVYIFPDYRRGGSETCAAIWSQTAHGMRFDNGKGFCVLVISPKLPKQQFEVKF